MPQTLHSWAKQYEVDAGVRDRVSTTETQRIKGLEREVPELRKANEILKLANALSLSVGARPPHQVLKAFVNQHRQQLGGESICRVLQIVPSAY